MQKITRSVAVGGAVLTLGVLGVAGSADASTTRSAGHAARETWNANGPYTTRETCAYARALADHQGIGYTTDCFFDGSKGSYWFWWVTP
ncbi:MULTISPECIES: hypothetical protein [Actinomadura]|uniref:Secreted protein n=1 Tax=Actinomadura yumaensis TaxID=111807 RepID=A0ABW2CI60_9ACTN|nr:hypothetical protein [Actinomadura sp. J1-007]MWK34968.1 hypothetical protein [Actinomadura sp. J1-007]